MHEEANTVRVDEFDSAGPSAREPQFAQVVGLPDGKFENDVNCREYERIDEGGAGIVVGLVNLDSVLIREFGEVDDDRCEKVEVVRHGHVNSRSSPGWPGDRSGL